MVEDSVRKAIVSELERQAEAKGEKLKMSSDEERIQINGEVNLDELVMAILGSVAGGP